MHRIFMYSDKVMLAVAKITIPSIHPLYPVPSPPLNYPIIEVHISKINRRQILCQYIHVLYILYPFILYDIELSKSTVLKKCLSSHLNKDDNIHKSEALKR